MVKEISSEMTEYVDVKLRFDILVEEDLAAIKKWIEDTAASYYVVEEDHDANRHIHAYMHVKIASIGKLRGVFRNKFRKTHSGNKCYSMEEMWKDGDHEGYFRYLSKGRSEAEQPVVVTRLGFQFVEVGVVEKWHSEYYEESERRKSRPAKKRIIESIEQEVIDRCNKRKYTAVHRLAIIEVMYDVYKERQKGYTSYEFQRKLTAVLMTLDVDGDFKKEECVRLCRMSER